jgi:hypothetical protein
MPHEICYPLTNTWFIISDIYGLVLPNQCMKSGKNEPIETFTDLTVFLNRLVELNITLNIESELDALRNGQTVSDTLKTQLLT